MTVDIADMGSFFGDEKIMTLEGFGGLGAFKPGQQDKGDTKQLVYVDKLIEGPHFWIGPFLLKANREGPYSIHVPVSKMRTREDYKKIGTWSLGQVQKLSKKTYAMAIASKTDQFVFKKDGGYVSPLSNVLPNTDGNRCPAELLGACIPKDQIVDKRFITGKRPIAKFDHPTFKRSGGGKEKWGMFLTLVPANTPDAVMPREHWKFTFKKISPGFWGKLWDWLASVVITVIEYVVDLLKSIIDGLMKFACEKARNILKEIQKAAMKKTTLPPSTRGLISKWVVGMTADTIDALIAGGTVSGVQKVGEGVINGICGPETPQSPPLNVKEPTSPIVYVAGAGILATGIWYFFIR